MQKKNKNIILIVIVAILLAFIALGIGVTLVGGILVANTGIENIFGNNEKEEEISGTGEKEEDTKDNQTGTELSDAQLSEAEILARVEDIKELYYGVENNISAFEVQDGGGATTRYLRNGQIRKITAKPSAYTDLGYESRYTAQYYYDNNKVAFVFVFYGTEEYRFYMDSEDCQKVIRYIDAAGNVHDYPKGISANSISLVGYYCGFAMQELHWAGIY